MAGVGTSAAPGQASARADSSQGRRSRSVANDRRSLALDWSLLPTLCQRSGPGKPLTPARSCPRATAGAWGLAPTGRSRIPGIYGLKVQKLKKGPLRANELQKCNFEKRALARLSL